MKYQWVYSSGKPGPVQTVSFTGAGDKTVSGETVKTKKAGSGWAEIKIVSPAALTSNKASYKLLCGASGTGQISASAFVQVPSGTGTCPATPPNLTATGSITSAKAGTVTYYWAQSDGAELGPRDPYLHRAGHDGGGAAGDHAACRSRQRRRGPGRDQPGRRGLQPRDVHAVVHRRRRRRRDAWRDDHGQPGEPVAHVLLRRRADVHLHAGRSATTRPGRSATTGSCRAGTAPTQTVSFTQAGSRTVSTAYKPASDSASGSGALVITSPASVTSNAAAFTLTCGQALALTNNAPATATVGAAYSGTVTVAGGKGTYTWAAVTGLPAGLKASASGATLTISGTPTAAGAATVALSVHDSATPQGKGTTSLTITVGAPAMSITSGAATTATVGKAYSGTVTVTGGNGTYTWGAVTGLPAGLTSSASGGTLTISGTPTTAGTSTVTVTARDTESTQKTATTSLTITVSAPALSITTGSLPAWHGRRRLQCRPHRDRGHGHGHLGGERAAGRAHDQLADRNDQRHAGRVGQLPRHDHRHGGHDGICDDHPRHQSRGRNESFAERRHRQRPSSSDPPLPAQSTEARSRLTRFRTPAGAPAMPIPQAWG